MKSLVYAVLVVTFMAGTVPAAILVSMPNGVYITKSTLSQAVTSADTINKTVVVTSALSAVQSNISSATTTGTWPSNRALRVEMGGSINPTTKFVYPGSYQAVRVGRVTFGNISTSARISWGAKPAFRGALVYGSQTITDMIVLSQKTWSSEAYDTDNIHNMVTNTERLTVPTGVSKVRLSFQVVGTASVGGWTAAKIFKNTAGVQLGTSSPSFSTSTIGHTATLVGITAILQVVPGDYFRVMCAGNPAIFSADANGDNDWFAMEIIE